MLLDHLRRVTRDGTWIPEIDGLRFVAISSVLLYHLFGQLTEQKPGHIPIAVEAGNWWLARLLNNGGNGVFLFFVISGTILALPFARHYLKDSRKVSLRKYYMRRVTRLEPPYITSFILCALATLIYFHKFTHGYLTDLLASIFYQHSLLYGKLSLINGLAWTLEIEIQFYLLAPLAMQYFRIRPTRLRRALMLAVILCITEAQLPFWGWPRFELSILYYLQYFLAGLLVADIFVVDIENMKSSWLWDLAGIASLIAIFFPPNIKYSTHALLPLPLAVLCIATMRSYSLRRVLANQWVAVIGGMCYSIYLLHFLFMATLYKATKYTLVPRAPFALNFLVQIVLTLLPAVTLCVVFYWLVERPCMDPNWPSKLWHALTGRRESEVAVLDTKGI